MDPSSFEVIVIDDGGDDASASAVADLIGRSPLAAASDRHVASRGPAAARNLGVRLARGPLLAFTDDDCLPDAGWLSAISEALAKVDVVQGTTTPPEGVAVVGAWDHAIWIRTATPLFETCNLGVRAEWFERIGGFDEEPLLTAGGGSHFGEDALLGGALLAAGASRSFAADAVVRHRWVSGSFADHLRARSKLQGFPLLARRSAAVRSSLTARVFLSRRTAAFDLGFIATLALLGRRQRWWLLVAWLPWLRAALPEATERGRGLRVPVRLGQLGLADALGLAYLAMGSIRHRRAVL
jgi:glycosyltransferase involved in cell wall biosynthesis